MRQGRSTYPVAGTWSTFAVDRFFCAINRQPTIANPQSPTHNRQPMCDTVACFASALLALVLVSDPPLVEHVHTVEINHVSGRFTQLIYRDKAGFIRDWRVLNDESMLPTGGYASWNDHGTWRSIRVDNVYETWTDHDPEVLDRKWRPEGDRRKLGQ